MVRTFLQAKPVSPLDVSPIMISWRHQVVVCYFFGMNNKVMELKYPKKSQLPFSVLTSQKSIRYNAITRKSPSSNLQGPLNFLVKTNLSLLFFVLC